MDELGPAIATILIFIGIIGYFQDRSEKAKKVEKEKHDAEEATRTSERLYFQMREQERDEKERAIKYLSLRHPTTDRNRFSDNAIEAAKEALKEEKRAVRKKRSSSDE